jgi:predicted metal-dependent peptidase
LISRLHEAEVLSETEFVLPDEPVSAVEERAAEKILKAVVSARRKSRADSYRITTVTLTVDWDCPSGWTDGVHIGYNPSWIDGLSVSIVRTFLVHEVDHIKQGLPWRLRRLPAKLHPYVNAAADFGINARLVKAGYEPIPNWLFDESYANRSVEDLAWELYRENEAQQPPEPEQGPDDESDGSDPSDDPSSDSADGTGEPQRSDDPADEPGDEPGEGGDEGDEGTGESPGEPGNDETSGSGEGGEGEPGEGQSSQVSQSRATGGECRPYPIEEAGPGDPSEEAQARDSYQKMRGDLSNAVRYAEANGGLTEAERLDYAEILEPETPWQEILRECVDEIFPDDYSYEHPERDLYLRKFYVPGLHDERIRTVVFGVDTSGSMDREAFAEAAGHTRSICEDLNAALHVVYCDSKIKGTQDFEPGDPDEFVPRGGGGTDFRPFFDYVEAMDDEPSAIVFFTDMKCQRYKFPETEPSVPTFFVQYGNFNHPNPPDWANVLRMEGERKERSSEW